MAEAAYDGVMLVGFGGPEGPAEIAPFLARVLEGRPIPAARYAEVVRHYELIGGSPYNALTARQAAALSTVLARRGRPLPVAVGLRHARPSFADALAALGGAGCRRVLGFILSPFQCEASWERYQREVAAAQAEVSGAPVVSYPPQWHLEGGFIRAAAAQVAAARARLTPDAAVEVIFTAHSIPRAMAAGAPYEGQLRASAAAVAAASGVARWTVAYQSRSGNPREPWLEPDIRDAIVANRAAKIVAPLGFLVDHVEVLYDLDIEAAAVAAAAGVAMVRAGTVGLAAEFVELISALATAGRPDGAASAPL